MKKVMMILAALLVLPLAAGTCLANSTTIPHDSGRTFNVPNDDTSTTGQPDCTFNLSKFVSFAYNCTSTHQSYSIDTCHWSGDKVYGTASDTTLLYWQSTTTGHEVAAGDLTNGNSADVNWTQM